MSQSIVPRTRIIKESDCFIHQNFCDETTVRKLTENALIQLRKARYEFYDNFFFSFYLIFFLRQIAQGPRFLS